MSFTTELPLPIPDFNVLNKEACFLILDGSQIEKLELLLLQQDLQPQAICPIRFLPLREVSSFIVKLTSAAMSWFTQYNHANVGYIISSEASIEQLAIILSDFFEVLSAYGSKVFFKVGQPEAMNVILNDQECHLWESLSKVWLPTRKGWVSLNHDETISTKSQPETYHLSDQQWKQLGDITRRNTVEKVHQHLTTYFPMALKQHNAPLLWTEEWVKNAHDMHFETDTDVLHFFNILALLGENVLKTDRYPHIKQLLETPSAQTPSMRVTKADELAHKEISHVK
ncbi:DUF4123 domain-containing protein [Photobacterium toruni]|uniref:DUF4123 domain-containing protein n=1 Tax=Photobacterium toruni TaxID=1935446 RepID=A0A1T4UIE6_9GAMM|nr:DUF4123 domain-containing protein [Photobacterium toruni]SKA52376.1 hypothetical protein CZ814_03282 [Photobacterium toruni]